MPNFRFRVKHVDNILTASINQLQFCALTVGYDPTLDLNYDLTPNMHPGANVLTVQGWNQAGAPNNPWHFEYEIYQDDHLIAAVNINGPGYENDGSMHLNQSHILMA